MKPAYVSHLTPGRLIEEESGVYIATPEADELQQMEAKYGGRFRYVTLTRARLAAAVNRTRGFAHLEGETQIEPIPVPLPAPVIADSQGESFVILNLASAMQMLEGRARRFTVLQLYYFN
jgi:hypothetical protein